MTVARALAGLVVVLGGCMSYTRDIRVVEYPAGTRHVDRAVAGSRSYHASAAIEGAELMVTLSQAERCEVADVPLVRRVRVTAKTQVPSPIGLRGEFLAGALAAVLGGAMIADPGRACASNDSDGAASGVDPATCSASGWGIVLVGAAITSLAIVDAARGSDEQEPLDVVEGAYERSEQACHNGPADGVAVELRLGDHLVDLPGKTSPQGVVSFSMIETPSNLLPSPEAPAQLAVGGEVIMLDVSYAQRGTLFRNLLASRSSRVVADLADSAQARCDRDVDRARHGAIALDDTTIHEALERWQEAQTTCAARWTPDHQRERETSERAILDNRIDTVIAALTANQLDLVDHVLAEYPRVASALLGRPEVIALLRKLVGEPARAIAARGAAAPDARDRLCRAHRIVVAIGTEITWTKIESQIAQNISELAGTPPATIVRKLETARCEP